MDEYIERRALLAAYDAAHKGKPGGARKPIEDAPALEVVPKGLYDQIKWERDVAIDQLTSYGVSLGEKAELERVKHGKWLPQVLFGQRAWDCSECKTLGSPWWKRCPVCEAKMDGKGEG